MARPGIPLTCALLAAAATAEAHHSISGAYDTRRTVEVDGVVARFEFVNPHSFITLDVGRDGGPPEQWRLEMDDRGELSDIGMTAGTLRPGDRLIVSGHPARREEHRLYISRLDRPSDGYGYEQVRGRPRLRPAGRR